MSNRAWVTLATNDSYSLGALVLAHSLRRAGSAHPSVVLITPSVTDAMKERLSAVFAEVITVNVLDSQDAAHLALLQRPELGITFTKIHCWNLTQYEKCVFLDADTLVVQNCDELFEREELSAAPDVGWPDCFNSGVFVFRPSAETFSRLITFAQEHGSFDGGDQGLLNSYFSDWARGDINKHLPFLYNVTSAAFYSYIPALKHYGSNLKIIHFIGAAKPWLQQYNWDSNTVDSPDHIRGLLQLWWDIFVGQVHTQLDVSMVDVEEEPEEVPPEMPPQDVLFHYSPKLDPESEFPWHHPEAQIPKDIDIDNKLDPDQVYDPWEHYRGSMPENTYPSWSPNPNEQKTNMLESGQPNYSYLQPEYSQHDERQRQNPGPSHWKQSNQISSHITHCKEQKNHIHASQNYHHYQGNQEVQTQNHYSDYNHSLPFLQQHPPSHQYSPPSHQHHPPSHQHSPPSNQDSLPSHQSLDHQSYRHFEHKKSEPHVYPYHDNQHYSSQSEKIDPSPLPYNDLNSKHEHNEHHQNELKAPSESYSTFIAHLKQRKPQYVYCVHLDHNKPRKQRQNKLQRVEVTVTQEMMNGHNLFDAESEDFDDVIPRHPYDGFYLRHRVIIDSCGKKVCTHEIPPAPTPPVSPLPDYLLYPSNNPMLLQEDDEAIDETSSSKVTQNQTGVAGNLARVTPGATSTQREAIDELARRQGWEAGNIDYMGADSFDNIWAKISKTLNQPKTSPPRQSPPKQPSPPKEQLEQAVPEVQPSISKEPGALAVDAAQAVDAVKVAAAPQEETQGEILPPTKAVIVTKSEAPVVAPIESAVAAIAPSGAPDEKIQGEIVPPLEDVKVTKSEVPVSFEALTESAVAAIAPESAAAAIAPESAAAAITPESVDGAPKPVPTVETPVVPAQVPQAETASVTPSKPEPTESPKAIPVETLAKPTTPDEGVLESKIEAKVESQALKTEPIKSQKTEIPSVPPTPPVTPKSTPEASTPVSEEAPKLEAQTVAAADSAPDGISKPVPEAEVKDAKKETSGAQATDSPPLVNTPSKEEAPTVPAAKSEEKRRPAGKLRLSPGGPPDPLPTPDSELEDAASLAHAIIAGELRTPTVTSPSPPASTPASPPLAAPASPSLAPQAPDVPTPPVGAVSLAQIGVKSKTKPSTADAIESSLSEAIPSPVTETPKKKIVKKVVKKETAPAGGEVPVPPPRKKEKKPKDK